ncbi:hypothetical protein [Sphingobium sp. CFD-2]|uniref:hypothetical protein n=1 Tax=Sphingobium sp. CFD-2 TaxID=2878542 RepID=UPI0011AEE91A|nr:hypothetical protein [Sphingobium sp. CFD-2]
MAPPIAAGFDIAHQAIDGLIDLFLAPCLLSAELNGVRHIAECNLALKHGDGQIEVCGAVVNRIIASRFSPDGRAHIFLHRRQP